MLFDDIMIFSKDLNDFNKFMKENNHLYNRSIYATDCYLMGSIRTFEVIMLDQWSLRKDYLPMILLLGYKFGEGSAVFHRGGYNNVQL